MFPAHHARRFFLWLALLGGGVASGVAPPSHVSAAQTLAVTEVRLDVAGPQGQEPTEVLTAPGEVIGIILSGVVPARTYSLTYDWVQAPEARVCALPDAVHRQQDVTLPPDDKLGFNLKRDGESTGGLPPRLR